MDSDVPMSAQIVVATVASYAAGWLIGSPALVPLLNTLAGYPFMLDALRRGQIRLAVARMLVWALALAVCATLLSYGRPWQTDTLFINGAAYRQEMFAWVMSGRGAESTPSQFIPQQAMHALGVSALALVSGGLLAMLMGAILMNYMGHYVGALAATSAHPAVTMVLGWHPWAVIRIASFVAIAIVLSTPLLGRLYAFRIDRDDARRIVVFGLVGLLADVVLKALLAPAWQRLLLRVVGW
ncbi:MAG TPA: hypothetical protein VGJ29_13305 [Vicinamibacterales bacterium]